MKSLPLLVSAVALVAGWARLGPASPAQQAGDSYVDRVVRFLPGNPASTCCNDPNSVLGPPDFNADALSGFLTLGIGGSVTVEFVDNLVVDGAGPDLYVIGDPWDDERIKVEVSVDGTTYKSFGFTAEQSRLDLATLKLDQIRFVRISDDGGGPAGGASPGAEIDAVQALNSSSTAVGPGSSPAASATHVADRKSLTWVRTGGPLGGLGYDIRMRPDNPDILFATDAWAGVHMSMDGGETWLPSNDGITDRQGDSGDAIAAFCLTIDPNNNDIVWTGTQWQGQLYRSADGGRTWEKRVGGIGNGEGLSFRGITVQPGNSNIVYAAGEVSPSRWAGRSVRGLGFDLTKGVLYKSTDGGLHWGEIWQGDNLARYVWIDPTDVQTLYLSTGIFDREAANSDPTTRTPGGVGLLKSTDGGATWTPINTGLRNLYIGSLYMHPEDPRILLAGAGNNVYPQGSGVYLTIDGGAHWQLVFDSGDMAITSVEFATGNTQIAYAGGQNAFAVSRDGGRTWQRQERVGNRWGPVGIMPGFPIDFQVDPRNAERIFANNYGGGNFLSEDGGRTWISSSTGYTGADLRSIAVYPTSPAIVYTNGRSGPFMSRDGGEHWQGINPENLAPIVEGSQIGLDPGNPQHIIMTESNRPLIYWSDDGGSIWQESENDWGGLTDESGTFLGGVEALAYAPSRPSRVYAVFGNNGCKGSGLGCDSPQYISTLAVSDDGGRSWTQVSTLAHDGMPGTSVVVHPDDPKRAWVAMPMFGVQATADDGMTWQGTSRGLGSSKVVALAIDPSNGDRLFAGTLANGVFKSVDGGQNWQRSSAGMDPNEPIYSIAFSPAESEIIYAGGLRSGVFRSEDGGQRWVSMNNGLLMRAVHDLALSADGGTLFATTHGGGVFRLDLNNQPPQPVQTSTPPATRLAPAATTPAPAAPTPSQSGRPGLCSGSAILPLVLLVPLRRRLLRRRDGQ